jgi:hypothetical protein
MGCDEAWSARTATAQCRALGVGPGLAVLIWRHLYSSVLLVSSSYRSFSAWARPAVKYMGSWVLHGLQRVQSAGCRPGSAKLTLHTPGAPKKVEFAAARGQRVARPCTWAVAYDTGLLP